MSLDLSNQSEENITPTEILYIYHLWTPLTSCLKVRSYLNGSVHFSTISEFFLLVLLSVLLRSMKRFFILKKSLKKIPACYHPDNCHKQLTGGKSTFSTSRPIIVKFLSYKPRKLVYDNNKN